LNAQAAKSGHYQYKCKSVFHEQWFWLFKVKQKNGCLISDGESQHFLSITKGKIPTLHLRYEGDIIYSSKSRHQAVGVAVEVHQQQKLLCL
jgi:hypothetical protein